jgi:hypothetical protein
VTIIPYPLQSLVKLRYPMDRDYARSSVLRFEPRPDSLEPLAEIGRSADALYAPDALS